MNRLKVMPESSSSRCSSSLVPRVTATSAWVSPRVKSAEPWTRGSSPTSLVMVRTTSCGRPPMRPPLTVSSRMCSYLRSSTTALASFSVCGVKDSPIEVLSLAMTSFFTVESAK